MSLDPFSFNNISSTELYSSRSFLFVLSFLSKTMAPLFFRGLKGGNLSCASPGSLAVCTSIDRRSMVRPAIVSRAIGRGSPPHLEDPPRRTTTTTTTTKHLKVAPKPPSNIPRKSRKSSECRSGSSIISSTISPANSSRYLLTDSAFFDIFPELEPDLEPAEPSLVPNMLSSSSSSSSSSEHHDQLSSIVPVSSPRLLRECSRGDQDSSPSIRRSSSSSSSTTTTTRTTHRDRDQDWAPSLVPISSPSLLHQPAPNAGRPSPAILKASSSTRTHRDHEQVVVLRVSLHCKGCEGKVRKHVSKMEGVTSFNIDFAAKKVTVTGNVTPLGVLNSVSKVKNAQFWPSSSSSLSPPRSSASF